MIAALVAALALGQTLSGGGGCPVGGDCVVRTMTARDAAGIARFSERYVGTLSGVSNPYFSQGDLFSGGVGLNILSFTYGDDTHARKRVFLIEQSGTTAVVGDGNRRSNYEGYTLDGEVNPGFRLTGYPAFGLELGPGGVGSVSMTRTGGNLVTWDTGTQVHGFSTGDVINVTCSVSGFAGGAFTATVIDPTHFSYTQAGTNGTSSALCQVSAETDVKLRRIATNQLALVMGVYGSELTKVIFYSDSMATQSGYDLAIGGGVLYTPVSVNHVLSPIAMQQTATFLCDATAGNVILNLPAAGTYYGKSGRIYNVVKVDASGNTCTIARAAADTINTAAGAGATSYVLLSKGKAVSLTSDGVSAWWGLASQ